MTESPDDRAVGMHFREGFSEELVLGRFGHGWVPNEATPKDWSIGHPDVAHLFAALGIEPDGAIPEAADHRQYAGEVRSQGAVNACTAFAVCGIVAYLQERAFGTHETQSPRFIFKVTTNLLQHDVDRGAHTRSALGALATIGSVPERFWPWDEENAGEEPSAFCYALATNRRAVSYIRLDQPHVIDEAVIKQARQIIAAGLPLLAGFTLFDGPVKASVPSGGAIPLPTEQDTKLGGHAVVVLGYDDHKVIGSHAEDGVTTTGAFLIQNSWGDEWGESGFGWLPYAYVAIGQSVDWWVLLGEHWIETGRFGF